LKWVYRGVYGNWELGFIAS